MNLAEFWSPSSISSNFGDARPNGRKHRGTDYAHSQGTPIPSPLSGTVVGKLAPSTQHGFGYQVTIRAASGETYSFSHLAGESPQGVGGQCTQGETLGAVGQTGFATGPCVHVEYNNGGFSDAAPHIAGLVSGGGSVPAGAVANGGVRAYQELLNAKGYGLDVDGINGPKTKAAVKDFQSKNGLTVDGIVGPQTIGALTYVAPAPAPAPSGGGSLADVQRELKTRYPLYAGRLVVDGIDGPNTRAAVKEYQRRAGLTADGIAGPITRASLGL